MDEKAFGMGVLVDVANTLLAVVVIKRRLILLLLLLAIERPLSGNHRKLTCRATLEAAAVAVVAFIRIFLLVSE